VNAEQACLFRPAPLCDVEPVQCSGEKAELGQAAGIARGADSG